MLSVTHYHSGFPCLEGFRITWNFRKRSKYIWVYQKKWLGVEKIFLFLLKYLPYFTIQTGNTTIGITRHFNGIVFWLFSGGERIRKYVCDFRMRSKVVCTKIPRKMRNSRTFSYSMRALSYLIQWTAIHFASLQARVLPYHCVNSNLPILVEK